MQIEENKAKNQKGKERSQFPVLGEHILFLPKGWSKGRSSK